MINELLVHKTEPYAFNGWDWKEEPQLAKLLKIQTRLSKKHGMTMKLIEVDTHCDEGAYVLGPDSMTKRQARKIMKECYEVLCGDDDGNPHPNTNKWKEL